MTATAKPTAPATLTDVARRAGVSPATVSRILNGTAKVADDKREAVLAAISELNFAPNQMAQSLKHGRSMTIGIVVQDIASPFFDEILHGVDDGLKGTGYASVIVSGHWDAEEEAERIRLLLARKVDGIVLLSGRMTDATVLNFAAQRPIVSLGRVLGTERAIGFRMDNEYGAWLAVRHLVDLGHRRIAHLCGPADNRDAVERLAGYKRALKEAGIAYDPKLVVEATLHEAGGMQAMQRLVDSGQQFSAIFAVNDQTAYGARLFMYRKGIGVPDDVSLVGFDDLPGSSYTTPPLTTIRQPLYVIGQTAVQSLLRIINGEAALASIPPVELVVRETTRALA